MTFKGVVIERIEDNVTFTVQGGGTGDAVLIEGVAGMTAVQVTGVAGASVTSKTEAGSLTITNTLAAVGASGAEVAPSGFEGIDCSGNSQCAIAIESVVITNYDLELWLKTATGWVKGRNSDSTHVTFSTVTTSFGYIFNCAGFSRIFLRMTNPTGFTSANRVYIPYGPGL